MGAALLGMGCLSGMSAHALSLGRLQVLSSLGESLRPDDAASAAANRWPLEVQLSVELEHVELVLAPGVTLQPIAEVEINGLG